MRVDHREPEDPGNDRLAIVPDSTEDLWHLQYILEPGDLVAGEISRRLQRDDDRMRDTGGQRETMFATLAVEDVEFQRFADRLRIAGTIVACSREDQIGFSHTLNVSVHDEIEVEKRLKSDQWDRLEDAQAATGQPDVVVITIEEGRADVFDVTQYGVEHRSTLTTGSGKRSGASTRADLFADVASIVDRSEADAIVLAGPGFAKQDCLDHLEDAHIEGVERIRTVDTSSVGERGVQEVLTRGVIDDIRSETRIGQEAELIEALLERLRTRPDTVAYGPAETATVADYGAVETLCVVDDILMRERGEDAQWDIDIDGVIESVEQQGGAVRVFTAAGEPGQQLESLGGVAAILRYPVE